MNAPRLAELLRYFLTLGATGFGGPVALASIMRRDLVEQRAWLDEDAYDRGLAIATACPGPMAYQLGVYCGYITHGVRGALGVAIAFALPPFAIVVAAAMLYERFAAAAIVRGLFYGVGPVVVALILRASWDLGRKTLKRDAAAGIVALAACAITIGFRQELTWLFLAAGALGAVVFARRAAPLAAPAGVPAPKLRTFSAPALLAVAMPNTGLALPLFWFFLKTGFLVFGSGLVIVSFVKTYIVDQYHWLDNATFVDAVAIGMITPGPVVITATFVGYAIAGFGGALASTLGIFMPSVLLTIIATPLLLRYGTRPRVAGFVRGVTVSVVGVLAGTTYLLARPIIVDAPSAALTAAVLAAPFVLRRGLPDHVFIAVGAVAGIALRG